MWKAAKRLQLRDRHDAVRGWSRRRHHTSDDTEGSGGQSSGGGGSEDAMRRRSEGVLSSSTMMSPRATRASHEGAATTIDVSSPRRAPHRPSSSFFHAVRVPLVSKSTHAARSFSILQLSTSSRQDDKATKTLGIIMSVFIGETRLFSVNNTVDCRLLDALFSARSCKVAVDADRASMA